MTDGLFWPGPAAEQDLHLTVGLSSGRLDQRIYADIGGIPVQGDDLTAPHALAFLFPPQDDPALWQGITVDPVSGRVSVPGPLPPDGDDRVLQIDVEIRLRHATSGDVGNPLFVKIWIHDRLEQVWLTPSTLTVHELQHQPSRLRPIARFWNGPVPFTADVTAWLPWWRPLAGDEGFAEAIGETVPLITWSATGVVAVEEGTGRTNAVATGTGTVTAATRLPGVAPATAALDAVTSWSTPTRAEFRGGAGQSLVENVANILFLPDGFLAEDEELFRTLMDGLVRTLLQEPHLEPLPLLADQVNYWIAWVPSPRRGISHLREGLLQMNDHHFGEFGDRTSITAPRVEIGQAELDQGRQEVLNLNDTAFHLARGERRRARARQVNRATVIDEELLDPSDFDAFLAALTDPQAPAVGRRWASGGSDQANVVIVGLSSLDGGANALSGGRPLSTLTTGEIDTVPVHVVAAGVDIGLDVVPAVKPSLSLAALVAHELGHSWGLGDEYTELGWSASTASPNLQTRAEVSDPGSGRLDGARVRWNWPRLDAAAVLTAAPEPSDQPLEPGDASWQLGRVMVTVTADQASPFAVGDLVRVRTRPLLTAVTSAQHRVTVIARRAEDDAVELEAVNGTTDLLEPSGLVPFTAGSVLILPRLDDEPGPVTAEASLMHPAVRDHVSATSNPLNAAAGAPSDRACVDTEVRASPVFATNLPPGLTVPGGRPSWQLVGLFEGGGRASCGVYHAAGGCMMNSRTGLSEDGSGVVATPFCPVCRYALIDLLHPPMHPAVDQLYDAIYPVLDQGGTP